MGREKSHAQPGGYQPITPQDLLWEGWEKDIYAHYCEGGSDIEVQAMIIDHEVKTKGGVRHVRFTDELWTAWLDRHEDFRNIIHSGRKASEAWWVKQGKTGTEFVQGSGNKRTDAKQYAWNMRNRFRGRYSDSDTRLELAGDPDAPFVEIKAQLSDQDADTAYYELMERARKSTAPHPGNPMKNRKGRKGEKAREQAREDQARHEGEE